jgi:hypothetical protein
VEKATSNLDNKNAPFLPRGGWNYRRADAIEGETETPNRAATLAAGRAFFHPDCTVGSGVTPDRAP